ncbi:MAG TPA: glycosyltransferase family 4 protein [Rubricoccaceae bacterium]|nr:glycosyltransferase family 4 protein [Rubricoccaceae bacterium]
MTAAAVTTPRPGAAEPLRHAGGRPVVALLPWGDLIEDYLDAVGLSLDAFCDEMTGGWLFGYVEALQRAGWEPVLYVFSGHVRCPERRRHAPTGATLWVLPPSRAYRWLRRATAPDERRPNSQAARWLRRLRGEVRAEVAPYLATPPWRLARALRRERCAAVLCQEYEYPRFDVCVVLGKVLRIPVYATAQGGTGPAGWIERRLRPRAVRAAAGLVAAAEREAARVAAAYGVPPSRIARVFNPLDLAAWRVPAREEARGALGIPGSAVVVAWHGRVAVAAKGLDVLLEAWAQIERRSEGRDVRLLVVGAGPDADAFRERIRALGLRKLTWVDAFVLDRSQVRRYLAAADVYAFPSRHEGFPVAPVEAMATGLPLVAADAPGVRDILPRGEADGGLVVPRGDAAALAAALARLIDDAPLRERMGWRARARVEAAFSTEAVGAQLAALLAPTPRRDGRVAR